MVGLVTPAIIGLLTALALRGSLAGWSEVRVHWWGLAVGALLVQVVVYNPPVNAWPLIVSASTSLNVLTSSAVLLVSLRNAAHGVVRAAWGVAALGILLNLAVLLANEGWMPSVDPAVAGREWRKPGQTTVNTRPLSNGTRLAWLADTIVEPSWLPFANVVSPGDVLLSLGCGWLCFVVTRQRRQSRS